MKISIVIPAYNEEKYIGRTLRSIDCLKKEREWEIEVMVVNGSSTDKTVEVAKSYGAKVISEPHKSIGFARQHGLMHAKGDIVVYTDADTAVPKDWLTKFVKALRNEKVVFAYGTFRVSDGTFPYYHFINHIQTYLQWVSHHLFNTPMAAGQNIAMWRDKAISIGGFDERLVVMEDNDLAIRMKKIGKVIFLKDVVVVSSGRRSKEGWGTLLRIITTYIRYFILKKKQLPAFPDYR